MRTIIVGDIHGCFYTLKDLLNKVKYNKQEDKIIFLGDYIDRGKNSYEVVSFLIDLQKEVGNNNCICLMGNHEDMWLEDRICSMYNGGVWTEESFKKHNVSLEHFNDWFKNLPLFYEADRFIACHAGFSHPKLKDHTKEELLWNRKQVLILPNMTEKQVIFGHTTNDDLSYYILRNGNVCIDTGCCFGGKLTAIIVEDNKPFQFIQTERNKEDI